MGCCCSKSEKEAAEKPSVANKQKQSKNKKLPTPEPTAQIVDRPPHIQSNGITILFDNTKSVGSDLDIVFIHGLNGHPERTWKDDKTNFYWPYELRNYLQNTRVMVFGYNASLDSELAENFIRIRGIAASLTSSLANKRIKDEQTTRPLVFICHSLGGLIAKAAAVAASQSLFNRANDLHLLYSAIKGFMFFGVPHGGSRALGKKRVFVLQKMAKAAFKKVPKKLNNALEKDSDEVLDLADNFRKTGLYVESRVVMASYYEQKSVAALGDRVVSEAEAAIQYGRANDPEPINANHMDMVRFDSNQNNHFVAVRELLQRWEVRISQEPVLPPPQPSNQTGRGSLPLCEEVRVNVRQAGGRARGIIPRK